MGITGLLPFLKKASRSANIKEFKGCTVAVDSYCWLHRGAFACADKLALGEPTDQYVYYCMKYVNSLLSYGLKPIMVFDGARLPSKEGVEKERRERRNLHRKKAAQLLREGRRAEARESLQKCVDITPTMALNLMNACRAKGVDCIVAPYEADAQLAYLSRTGIAQVIITEDSDLLLFGCDRVMFKMDFAGNGNLIEKKDLNKALDLKADTFTFDIFRYICIISGCDYLPNLPGIGLGKASKLFRLTRQTSIDIVLKKMPTTLKMSQLDVTAEYISGFHRANNTFLYQLCFDPRSRKMVPLTPYPQDMDPRELEYAGPYMSTELALQMALGNVDHYSGKLIADFDPNNSKVGPKTKDDTFLHMLSIWDPRYRPRSNISMEQKLCDTKISRESTRGKELLTKFTPSSKVMPAPKLAVKRPRQEEEDEKGQTLDNELVDMYKEPSGGASDQSPGASDQSPPAKRKKVCSEDEKEDIAPASYEQSPTPHVSTPSPTKRTCLQELKTNNDRLPAPPEGVEDGEVGQPESVARKVKSPRNKFAFLDTGKKNRFNLNAQSKATEVRSRFFVQSKNLKPKTQFFQSLEDILPANDDTAESALKSDPLANLPDDDSHKNTPLPTLPDTVSTKDLELEKLPALPTIDTGALSGGNGSSGQGRSSPHGSFGGWSKLQNFKSSFGKVDGIKSSPLTKKQFKPVTAFTVKRKEREKTKDSGDDEKGSGLIGGMEPVKNCLEGTETLPNGFNTPGEQSTTIVLDDDADKVKTWPLKSQPLSSQEDRLRGASLALSSTPVTSKKGCRSIGLSKTPKQGNGQKSKKQPLLTNFLSKFAYSKKETANT